MNKLKSLFSILIVVSTLFGYFTSNVDAQADPCTYVCRSPQSASCISCKNSNPTSTAGNPTTAWDPRCDGGNGIDTAIGCIHFDSTESFSGDLFGWAIGISGGVAFLFIVYSSFIIMTSQGDPNRLKAGQELLTAAISGTILLVLSVVVLKFVGIDILGLDRWGFGK